MSKSRAGCRSQQLFTGRARGPDVTCKSDCGLWFVRGRERTAFCLSATSFSPPPPHSTRDESIVSYNGRWLVPQTSPCLLAHWNTPRASLPVTFLSTRPRPQILRWNCNPRRSPRPLPPRRSYMNTHTSTYTSTLGPVAQRRTTLGVGRSLGGWKVVRGEGPAAVVPSAPRSPRSSVSGDGHQSATRESRRPLPSLRTPRTVTRSRLMASHSLSRRQGFVGSSAVGDTCAITRDWTCWGRAAI